MNKNVKESDLQYIHNLFSKWKPYEKYNLANCRGAFLEELSCTMLKEKNPTANIHTETQIILENYQSHYWDRLIINDIIKAYECKFSAYSIKRKHIDKMWGFKNKILNSKVYLIVYDNEKLIKQKNDNTITRNRHTIPHNKQHTRNFYKKLSRLKKITTPFKTKNIHNNNKHTDGDKLVNSGRVVSKLNGKTLKDESGKAIYANVINGVATASYTLPAKTKAKTYNLTAVFTDTNYDRVETSVEFDVTS